MPMVVERAAMIRFDQDYALRCAPILGLPRGSHHPAVCPCCTPHCGPGMCEIPEDCVICAGYGVVTLLRDGTLLPHPRAVLGGVAA
jgi:hypothetical protein